MFGGLFTPRAQAPGQSMQPQQQSGFSNFLRPEVAMPVAAALLGGQGNARNFSNAFAAAAPGLQQQQELRQEAQRKNQTIEFLKQKSPELGQALDAGMPVGEAWRAYQESLKAQAPAGPTDTMRNLQWRASQAGLQPGTKEYSDFMRSGGGSGGVTVNVGDGAPGLGKLSSDYGYKMDPETRQPIIDPETMLPIAAPIPGSPAAREIAMAEEKRGLKSGQAMVSSDVVVKAADRARKAAKERDFGPYGQGMVEYLPWTDSAEVSRQVNVLKSNAKIENLNAMRAASPTGGALGSVTEKESDMLAAKAGALDPSSPNFERDLNDYELTLLQVVHGPEAGAQIYSQTRPAAPPAAGQGGQMGGQSEVDSLIEQYGGM